jgi:osmotically inducible protein OsmC
VTEEAVMMRERRSVSEGGAIHGAGAHSTQGGGSRKQLCSFQTRFDREDDKTGTSPEEPLAVAHGGCHAMALAFALTEAGHAPAELSVTEGLDLSKVDAGFAIEPIAPDVEAQVPGIEREKFRAIAGAVESYCPVSKSLAARPITRSATWV